jgi:hypothetical protein
MKHNILALDMPELGEGVVVYQCVDCGAHAFERENVKHHASCKPGESEKWEKFYEDAYKEELE